MRLEVPVSCGRTERASRRVRAVVVVWVALLLVCCGRALVAPHTRSVYPIIAGAARQWAAGADLYGELAPDLDRFRYSPAVAALLVPLGWLPDGPGAALWRLLNATVYLGAFAWWARTASPPLTPGRRAVVFLLIVPLSVGSLHNGQSNPLVLGLLLATVAAVQTERWNVAAICAALASLIKIYPIAIGLLLAAAYPRRFAGRLALALAAGLALPFALQHFDYVAGQYASWWHHFQTYDRQNLRAELWYRDVRLLLQALGVPLGSPAYALVQLAGAAACAAACVAGCRAGWPRDRLLRLLFTLGCCWMTVLGPATESCTYILLAPALAWALLDTWRVRHAIALGLVGASYGLLLVCLVAVWFPGGRSVHTLGLQPLGGLLLLAGILTHFFTRRSPARVNDTLLFPV
jgi:hypothetical protein